MRLVAVAVVHGTRVLARVAVAAVVVVVRGSASCLPRRRLAVLVHRSR